MAHNINNGQVSRNVTIFEQLGHPIQPAKVKTESNASSPSSPSVSSSDSSPRPSAFQPYSPPVGYDGPENDLTGRLKVLEAQNRNFQDEIVKLQRENLQQNHAINGLTAQQHAQSRAQRSADRLSHTTTFMNHSGDLCAVVGTGSTCLAVGVPCTAPVTLPLGVACLGTSTVTKLAANVPFCVSLCYSCRHHCCKCFGHTASDQNPASPSLQSMPEPSSQAHSFRPSTHAHKFNVDKALPERLLISPSEQEQPIPPDQLPPVELTLRPLRHLDRPVAQHAQGAIELARVRPAAEPEMQNPVAQQPAQVQAEPRMPAQVREKISLADFAEDLV